MTECRSVRHLQHWRHHPFNDIRPFFCQIEAVETAIWLTEVAPKRGAAGRGFLSVLAGANEGSNPGLSRLALKLATGAGKTTVMAMIMGQKCDPWLLSGLAIAQLPRLRNTGRRSSDDWRPPQRSRNSKNSTSERLKR